jgi:4-amino-4-deoxy-L-arabinose transferase-like glycosyltransferase
MPGRLARRFEPEAALTEIGGWVRGWLVQLVRIVGLVWLAIVLLAASLSALQLVREVRSDPGLSAGALLTLGALGIALAALGAIGILELARRGRVTLALGLSVAALLAGRVLAIAAIPTPIRTDWVAYHNLGTALASGQSIDTARPIGWPAVLGALYRVGGPNPLFGELFNVGATVATALLLFWLTRRCFGPVAAVAATFIYAISPAPAVFAAVLASEPLFTALLIGAICLAILAIDRGWRVWIATGLVLAVAQYVRPAALILLPAFMALPILTLVPLRRAILPVILLGSIFVLGLVPNVVFQYERTGRLTLSTSNFDGLNLLVGLNEKSGGSYSREDRALIADIPPTSREFVDAPYRLALERLRADPLVVIRLAPTKFQRMWGDATYAARFAIVDNDPADPGRALLTIMSQGVHVLTLALALVGVLAWRSLQPVVILIILSVLMATLASFVIETQPRYHAPFEPLLCLLAGVGLAASYERMIAAQAGYQWLPGRAH